MNETNIVSNDPQRQERCSELSALPGANATLGEADPDMPTGLSLEDVAATITELKETLTSINKGIDGVCERDRVLADLNDECRRHRENTYHRDCVLPLFRGLVGLADRIRLEVQHLKAEMGDRSQAAVNRKAVLSIRRIHDARMADLIELEELLATHGITTFHHRHDRFDPDSQKCVRVIKTSILKRRRCIAQRLLPGYRLDDMVMVPERVSVYAATEPTKQEEANTCSELM